MEPYHSGQEESHSWTLSLNHYCRGINCIIWVPRKGGNLLCLREVGGFHPRDAVNLDQGWIRVRRTLFLKVRKRSNCFQKARRASAKVRYQQELYFQGGWGASEACWSGIVCGTQRTSDDIKALGRGRVRFVFQKDAWGFMWRMDYTKTEAWR